jgi:serine/threonine-protein kinase HipA
VYLVGDHVGVLERHGPTRYGFRYSADTLARYPAGTVLLSASLPVREEPYPSGRTKPFFEGLLPEGAIRSTIARALGLSEDNGFGLLAALGADCAGAVVVLPPAAPAPGAGTGSIEWLDDEALAQRVEDLPRNPLGVGGAADVRLSLAGVQPKLVVTRSPSGRIGQPTGGAPSTHVLKPPQEQFPDLVVNELLCLRIARSVGLRAASTELLEVGDEACLLVERWDRTIGGDGRSTRLHQEDFCQALGLLPSAKYEAEGGPSFAQMVEVLRSLGARTFAVDVNELVRALALNWLLGNADAHGKNYAILYERPGAGRLAPLYDVVSTAVYPDLHRSLAMTIGGVDDPDEVDAAAWRRLASASGLGAQVPRAVGAFSERVVSAARAQRDTALSEDWHRPLADRIVDLCEARARQLEL